MSERFSRTQNGSEAEPRREDGRKKPPSNLHKKIITGVAIAASLASEVYNVVKKPQETTDTPQERLEIH